MMNWLKDNCIPKAKYDKMSAEEKAGKTPIGLFVDIEKPEYTEQYKLLIDRAQSMAK